MILHRSPSPETIACHLRNTIKSKLALNHVCHFNRCNIVNLKVEIHKRNDREFGIKTKYLKTPKWITKDTFVCNIYSLYLCKNTGKIHDCNPNCDGERMTNDDNCQVCCVSGVQYQSESVRSWKVSARCVPTVIANKQDPYMFSRDKEGRVKLSGSHNLKLTQCQIISKTTIHNLLFSKNRMRNEIHKQNEIKRDAEKVVNKYKRYCDRNNITKNYIHMITLYESTVQKRPLHMHLINKTEEQQEEIIKMNTKLLIGYWKAILLKTELGNEMPSLFNFKQFVPSCLYIMKSGLVMNSVVIMKKSRYLESALPEANTLDLYNISKPSFTQTKNNILKAIRETIESKAETPQSFTLHVQKEIAKL